MKTEELIKQLSDRAKYDLLHAPCLVDTHLNWIAADTIARQSATIKALTEALELFPGWMTGTDRADAWDRVRKNATAQAREEE